MSAAEGSLALPRRRFSLLEALRRAAMSPRLYVYLSCTVLVVLTSYHLGKEMLWDTMDYHIYAGFSALHDRFAQDYFAGGPQGYFNPYPYVPFYLLIRSSLTPLEDASILAVLQSGILWLSYEMAVVVAPAASSKTRVAVGILAALFAFANPVLVNQFGSSFADVTTAEVALAGWLALLTAVQSSGSTGTRVLCGSLLLGAAAALKPTNALHVVSAVPLLLFVPGSWRRKTGHVALFAAGVGSAFVLVSAPWSLRLEEHFGNPVFPLLNNLFRSPQFTTATLRNYELVPPSLGAALFRPFALAVPHAMVDVEWIAPDLRYAALLLLTLVLTLAWARRRMRKGPLPEPTADHRETTRALAALGSGFALDWTLWLAASGNGRYFIPMACVAAVLGVAIIFRVFGHRPAVRNYVLMAVLGLQFFQLAAGTEFRGSLQWNEGPWFSLSIPANLRSQPNLYLLVGELTNSYIIPYLPTDSGFINLDGEYELGPGGATGARIESLIRRFAPRLQVLVFDPRLDAPTESGLPDPEGVVNALAPFGLTVDETHCSKIVAHGVTVPWASVGAGQTPHRPPAWAAHTEHLMSCQVAWSGRLQTAPLPGQRAADLAFDHLEEACPQLFQPKRPVDTFIGSAVRGYTFVRRYENTDIVVWIGRGSVKYQNPIGGVRSESVGPESAWETAPPRVVCDREGPMKFLPASR